MKTIRAADLLKLLAARHARDMFVPECRTGGALDEYHQRLDAWAIKRSWAHPQVIGYEIKISRADFLQDDKWRGYLPYCNEFYFVCPPSFIQRDELPEDAGLLWASTNAVKLYTKKRAPYRDVKIPESLWRSIIFSRVTIKGEPTGSGAREYWAEWLAERKVDEEFGWRVGRNIRQVVETQITAVAGENYVLKRQIATYKDIRQFLDSHGIPVDNSIHQFSAKRKVEALVRAVPNGLLQTLTHAQQGLERAHAALTALDNGQTEEEVR